MKTAISIPDTIFLSAERVAHRLKMSRSRFYVAALRSFLERFHQGKVTHKLNAVYRHEPSRLDTGLRKLQAKSFSRDGW